MVNNNNNNNNNKNIARLGNIFACKIVFIRE